MSDDILSGGAIDPSTSGPIPSSKDDRDRDILLQQKERQDQDAVGGTLFPPRTQPLPPIPEAPEVAPPLPVIPSFDFNFSGSALEETREIARQTVVDVLKNVTINGQGPSFEGSAIAFNIPQQPPASEAFIFQGVMVAQPLPPSQTIQAPALPQLAQQEPAQEIQSVVVAPPTRQQPAPKVEPESIQGTEASESIQPVLPQTVASPTTIRNSTTEEALPLPSRIESAVEGPTESAPIEGATTEVSPIEGSTIEAPPSLTQEPTFPEPAKPPTEILESDVILSPIELSLDETRPVKPQPVKPPKSKEAEPPSKPEEDEDFAPRYTKLSDYPPLEAGAQDESQKARDEARDRGANIGYDKVEEIRDEARNDGADIKFDKAEEIRNEARNRGADISFDDAAKEREEAREDGAVARGFKEGEARRKERIESDEDFDRESPIRQKGETPKEFKERQEELRQERAERVKNLERAREGDISEVPSGMIPVRLTRADGQKKILAFMATEFVGVVEGAASGERPATLPSEDSYYEGGGGGGSPHPWRVTLKKENDVWQAKVDLNSRVHKGLGTWDNYTVVGLDAWTDFSVGYVVVWATIVDGGISGNNLNIDWGTENNRIELDGSGDQSYAEYRIAYIYQEDDTFKVLQIAHQNLTVVQSCYNGNAILSFV